MSRKAKNPNILDIAKACAEAGRVILTEHASERMIERRVVLPEVFHVLSTGWHEKRKDKYDEHFDDWDYAIRSRSEDDRDLRVAIAIDEVSMVIVITVIDLTR